MPANPSLSREEIAQLEIGHTAVSRLGAAVLSGVFLAVVFSVPLAQWALDRAGEARPAGGAGWSRVAEAFRRGTLPEVAVAGRAGAGGSPGLLRRVRAANDQLLANLQRFEDRQREGSFLTRGLVTPFQRWTTRTLGLGNEQAYPGRDGWAFYRAGIDALTGPGFLDPRQLRRRAAGGDAWRPPPAPDPRPAVLEFHRYLSGRGIRLVLVPAPSKAAVHPEKFSSRYAPGDGPVRNPSFAAWREEMAAAGIVVVDPAPALARAAAGGAQYLATDTHWTPEAMAAVAEQVAGATGLGPGGTVYRREATEVSAPGDVAANLLRLDGTGVYPPQSVTIRPVVTGDGAPWAPREDAEILLLGDSFANIYSSPGLGWGGGAGLAEQLSALLQRPVDVIVENDAGGRATRLALARDLRRRDRLAGKKVVVWQFAARELAVGDWTRVDWAAVARGGDTPAPGPAPAPATGTAVRGRIEAISRSPRPGTVTYKDCLVQVHLVEVEGLDGVDELLLNLWGMRDNRLTGADDYQPGETRAFRVTDWEQAQAPFGLAGAMQRELEDPDFVLIDLPLYYAE